MRLRLSLLVIATVMCSIAAYQRTVASGSSRQQSATTTAQPSPTPLVREPSVQEINDRYVKQIAERIAGQEKEPASKVFKNIQLPWLKDAPAAQLVNIMNLGYSRALGVACTHCHVEQDFSSDEKRPKKAAREMAVMHRMINDQLGKMENLELKPQERFINCTTCHRGAINPRTPSK
jgi:Photosynthetic reaction centre cytochrome C subunit